MSLVGRLEDLSPADIVQIVYLSRRSGRLELRADQGSYSVSFSHGRIAAAASSESPDLATWLRSREVLSSEQLQEAERFEEAAGVDLGTVILDMNLLAPSALIALIEQRISETLEQIRDLGHGEFSFVLSDGLQPREIGYDLVALTGTEGYEPQKFLGAGEKIRPLQGLEETVRAGKAFLRGSREPASEPAQVSELPADEAPKKRFDPDSTQPAPPTTRFSVRGDAAAGEGSRVALVVYEADPVLRVAIRRGLSDEGLDIIQTGSLDESRAEIERLLSAKRFFITVADTAGHGEDGSPLVALVKRANPGLPVATLSSPDRVAGGSRMQPDEVIELPAGTARDPAEMNRAVEMVSAFVREERDRWLMMIAAEGSAEAAGRGFYEQGGSSLASRRLELIELLLVAVSDPEDILSLASTLLRAAAEYVDRGAIFIRADGDFLGLAGFGVDGSDGGVNESIKGVRIPADEESVLRDVASRKQAHRGKLRKNRANVELVQRLGPAVPSEVVALPIPRGETVIGVLYGDNGGNRAPISETSGLEILLGQAGRALEQGLESRARRARGGGGG